MNNEQSKLILSAYRPGGEDASDPFFTEALEQSRLDPELGKWLADQRRFDQSFQSALQSIATPTGLLESLLLNRKVVRLDNSSTAPSRGWGVPGRWMALAAALILLLGIGLLLKPDSPVPGTTMSEMQFTGAIHDLKAGGKITLGKMASNTDELRAWLASQDAPHDFPLPASLQNLEGMGCQTFIINGAKVSLLCFMLEKNQLVHLFVVDESAITNPPGRSPVITRDGEAVAATWSAAGRTYVLVGEDLDEETLRLLI